MRKYQALVVVELPRGVVGLTDNQADLRRGCLKRIGKGKFEILKPIQLKAGEVVRMAAIPKTMVGDFAVASDGPEAGIEQCTPKS